MVGFHDSKNFASSGELASLRGRLLHLLSTMSGRMGQILTAGISKLLQRRSEDPTVGPTSTLTSCGSARFWLGLPGGKFGWIFAGQKSSSSLMRLGSQMFKDCPAVGSTPTVQSPSVKRATCHHHFGNSVNNVKHKL